MRLTLIDDLRAVLKKHYEQTAQVIHEITIDVAPSVWWSLAMDYRAFYRDGSSVILIDDQPTKIWVRRRSR